MTTLSDVPAPARPDPVAFLSGALSDLPRPRGISLPGQGGKFATDGTVLRWPGCTFVCHIDPAGPAHGVFRAMQEEVKTSRFGGLFNWLPPSSFHMTMFQGTSPESAEQGVLPKGADRGMSEEAMAALMLSHVDGLSLGPGFRIAMREFYGCYTVTVTGADAQAEGALREARRRLSAATGFAQPDFEDYVFHVTLGYPAEWVTRPTAEAIVALSAELSRRYGPQLAEIPLGPVEFCTFETMHHFEPMKLLG